MLLGVVLPTRLSSVHIFFTARIHFIKMLLCSIPLTIENKAKPTVYNQMQVFMQDYRHY